MSTPKPLPRSTDRLWRAWKKAQSLRKRFEGRPLGDEVRQHWIHEEIAALDALKAAEAALLGGARINS